MATNQDATTEAHECAADFRERHRSAGVNQALISEMFDRINSERATAARLFYLPEDELDDPMTLLAFSDELGNMTPRAWALVAAVEGVFRKRDDSESTGVQQLANDVAHDMARLAEAFDAERWLARRQEAQP